MATTAAETQRFINDTTAADENTNANTSNINNNGDDYDPRSLINSYVISDAFKSFLLYYCIRYSAKLNRIFRDADVWTVENTMDICEAFDIRNEERARLERIANNSKNFLVSFLDTYLAENENDNLTFYEFFEKLKLIRNSALLVKNIHQNQEVLLQEFNNIKFNADCILIYHHELYKKYRPQINRFKNQLTTSRFNVKDAGRMSTEEVETLLKSNRHARIYILFDAKLNEIFDETTPLDQLNPVRQQQQQQTESTAPISDQQQQQHPMVERADVDYRHLGRVLYFEYLQNDCKNERIFTFLMDLSAENIKYPWLLREANNRNHIKTYRKPLSIPSDAHYVENDDNEQYQSIEKYLKAIYDNFTRKNTANI